MTRRSTARARRTPARAAALPALAAALFAAGCHDRDDPAPPPPPRPLARLVNEFDWGGYHPQPVWAALDGRASFAVEFGDARGVRTHPGPHTLRVWSAGGAFDIELALAVPEGPDRAATVVLRSDGRIKVEDGPK